MNRAMWLVVCALLGLVALVCGLLVPAHLRAVDAGVLAQAGRSTPSLVEFGVSLAEHYQLGTADLLFEAAENQHLPGREKLAGATAQLVLRKPALRLWGSPAPGLEKLARPGATPEPLTDFVVRLEHRERVLEFLRASQCPAVQELMRFRHQTNTVLFPPSASSSGQALDAALSIGGLLLTEGRLSSGLSNALFASAATANRGGNTQLLEEALMSFMSLGQRLNWGQLASFVGPAEDIETLRLEATLARRVEAEAGKDAGAPGGRAEAGKDAGAPGLPVLFAAVEMSHNPRAVANYLMTFSQTGLEDLGASLRYGTGAVEELLRRGQRLHRASSPVSAAIDGGPLVQLACHDPELALAVKWFLYLLAGFFLATAMHFAWPMASELERPLRVRGIHIAREVLFALGFLLIVLLVSEPFLAQESQKVEFPFRLRLPIMGAAASAGMAASARALFMNKVNLLTLLLFFVLQGLLYLACLVKLAEIRRQKVAPRMKLKLLENEDHLFDAGLYLGFVGTIISLILVSLNIVTFSLMAAYSSTSFGIIFVSIFKIFHLRPARRQLLLEAEAAGPEPVATAHSNRPAMMTAP